MLTYHLHITDILSTFIVHMPVFLDFVDPLCVTSGCFFWNSPNLAKAKRGGGGGGGGGVDFRWMVVSSGYSVIALDVCFFFTIS